MTAVINMGAAIACAFYAGVFKAKGHTEMFMLGALLAIINGVAAMVVR